MEGPERWFWQITAIKTIMLGDNWVHFTLCLSTLLRCDILLQLRFWIDAEGFVRYDAFKQKKKVNIVAEDFCLVSTNRQRQSQKSELKQPGKSHPDVVEPLLASRRHEDELRQS